MKTKNIIALIIFVLLLFSLSAYGEKPIKERLYIGGVEGLYIVKFEKLDSLKIESHIEKNTKITISNVSEDYLYIGYKNGISIFSLKDPKNPTLISKFIPHIEKYEYPSSYPYKIFIERDKMYIPYGISGILILDIKNKEIPEKISIYKDTIPFYDLSVKEKYIYAASFDKVVIINAKNPKTPKKIGVLFEKKQTKKKTKPSLIHLRLYENYLFIIDRDTLFIYDLKNPEAPQLIKKKKIGNFIEKFYIFENYIFVVDDKGFTLRVWDMKIKKKKSKKGEKIEILLSKKSVYKANYPIKSVSFFRDFIYLAMGKYGIEAVNMEEIEKISKKKGVNLYTDCVAITTDEKFTYAVDTKEGLIVLDKEKKIPINWYGTTKDAIDFYKTKRYGYLLQKGRLTALSVKDDGEPYRIDSINRVPIRAFRLYLNEQYIYIGALDFGIYIYSTKKDPTAPKLIKKYATDGNLYDMIAEGKILYLADGKAGFFVIDVTDTESIKILRKYKPKSPVVSIYKIDDIIYLGEKDGTFEIISLENPKKIEQIGKLKFESPIVKIKKYKNYFFLATGEGGVKILKFTSVYNTPKLVKTIDTNGYTWNMILDQNLLWIADGENGVVIYDLSDPENPKLIKDLDWFSANTLALR